ncbi:hypothetical protein HYQ58_1401 [Lactobacillus crispatus]|uniref:hypothetical protein n=2 Tax=Lactobacillus TaxID=1578 RepID=UPI001E4E2BBC|nr:hypothetical protein [Lactobacillus crispatus]MBI1694192.1 hypothetical protein [Lactobacillus crispatus]
MYQMKFIHKTPIKKGTYLRLRCLGTHYPWQFMIGGHYWTVLRNDARWFKNVR